MNFGNDILGECQGASESDMASGAFRVKIRVRIPKKRVSLAWHGTMGIALTGMP